MANLRKIIYINEEDYSTLINGDSLVIDGTTYTYEENALYVIKNAGPPEYAETAGYATNAGTSLVAVTDASGNNIAVTYEKKTLIIDVQSSDNESNLPSGTYNSITQALSQNKQVVLRITMDGEDEDDDVVYLLLVSDVSEFAGFYQFSTIRGDYEYYNAHIESDEYFTLRLEGLSTHYAVQVLDNEVVHKANTETITGNKTFTGTVSLGSNATATTPAATDNDTSVATTAFVHNVVNAIPKITTGQIVGRMHRDNVSGTGNLTIAGASGEGFSPNGITTAGKYMVVVYSWSDTKTFGYNISFGSNNYTLSTTDGTISDKRELTVSAGALWSGSVTTAVSAGTTIIVEIYKAEKTTPALSVGTVALTNLYNDLDGKPTISDSTSSTSSTDIASSKAVKLAYDHGGVQSVNGQTGAVNVNIPIINAVTETYSSTAADTETPFTASIWRVDLSDKITELYSGLTILIKVPVAGNGTYGTLLRIDGTDSSTDSSSNLYPVCANVTTMVSTRYAVDCIIPLTFDATQAGQTLYYNSASAYTTTASGTGWTKPGCWKIADYSTGDTTTGREGYYYMRPYAGQTVYRYKYLMEGADGRLYPIVTTNQTSGTSVTKTPTTVGLRPWKIWYYNHTDTVSAGAAFGALRVYPELHTTTATYNFNASTGTYAWIFLLGSYDKDTDLFTLDTGNNYYKFVRYNAAINWASSLTTGKYYILLGSSYSTTNYVLLYNVNPFYYFNGTNLIPVTTKIALDSGPVTSVNGLTGNVNLALGDTNVIESISVNGVAQTVTDKNVDITIEVPEGELSENYATSELENENLMLAAGDTYETAFSKIEKAIIDNEETVAGALNDLNERLLDINVPSSVSDLTDDVGIVKSITLNSNTYTPTNGVVDLGTITGTGTGEANIIESVKVNGTALTVTNKAVDITAVPASIVTADSTHRFVTDSEKTTWNAGQANVIETIKVNSTALTPDANKVVDISVPTKTSDLTNDSNFTTLSEVTLTIVNSAPTTLDTLNELAAALGNDANFATTIATQIGQKYTKPGTGIPASDLASAVQTSLGKADTALQSFTETDPVFSASAAAGITSSDITNWNNKTSNTGTVTGVKMNGTTNNPTSGVVDLGTVITSETSLSKGTTSGSGNAVTDISVSGHTITLTKGSTFLTSETSLSKGTTTGSGNAVTDISVSGHQITLTKGTTFLTSHQDIKTINNTSLVGTGNVTINVLPTVTSADNGKILQVVNGAWALVTPTSIYSGTSAPNNSTGNDGDLYLQTS